MLQNGVRNGDSSQSVVEEATVDDVAGEVIVDDLRGNYIEKPRSNGLRPYAASIALRTNDSLRGQPRVFVRPGRAPYAKLEPAGEVDDDPPRLSDPDGSYETPSMRAHFRIYADATLRKVSRPSTSQSLPSEEEITEHDNVHQLNDETATGEELEHHILDESHVLEQQEALDSKPGLFYSADDEHSMRTMDDYDECPLFAEHPVDFPEACDILLGNIHVSEDKVCKTIPHGYNKVGTYIIDWGNMDRQAIGIDGLGSWGKPSGRTRFYSMDVEKNKYVVVSDSRGQITKGTHYDAKCQLRKYEHPTTLLIGGGANRFIKKIISCVGKDNIPLSGLAIITYEWIGTPFEFSYSTDRRPIREGNNPPPPPEGARNWEAASFQTHGLFGGIFPATCTAMMGDCPLYSMGAIQFHDVCNIIMGATIVDNNKICDRIPQRFRECGTFVIAVNSLGSENELRRDDNGLWGKPAGNSRYFKYDGVTATRLDRCGKLSPGARARGSYDLQILCKRYEHPLTGNRFVRKIYSGRSPLDKDYHQTFELAVITYFWKGEPIPFEIVPQRKVRVHNSSDYEIIKRNSEMRVYEEEMDEADMMEDMHGEHGEEGEVGAPVGGGMYMQHENALVDEDMPMPPPVKRVKAERRPSMGDDRHHMRQEAGGGHPHERTHPHADMQWAKMALENQQRFAMLLDRFESVAEKMERMTEMQMNMMWRPRQYSGDHEQRDRPEGEVQYVEEEVYDMDGE